MIIRSLRNIAEKYHNNNNMLSIISADETPHMTFETNGNGVVKISDDFPKRMVLNAKIMPVQNFSKAKLERKINGKAISYCDLYSHYENKYCSSVEVVFENGGHAISFDNEKISFSDKNFEDYQIVINDNILLKKDFLTTQKDILENINNDGIILQNNQLASRVIYPYGGVYQYGLHPKVIEQAICFWSENNELRTIALSAVQGVNPAKNTLMKSGKWFIGVQDFAKNYRTSLYDDILNGGCKFTLKLNDSEKVFVSNSLNWFEKTNLLQVGFVAFPQESTTSLRSSQ